MLSKVSWLLAAALMCYASCCFYPKWKQHKTEATISWDVSGYYWYLPSIFIYHDLKHHAFKDSILSKYEPTNTEFQQGVLLPNGNYVMKYSSGMALMYLPFFSIAHILAKPLGFPSDGFSAPYQLAIQIGGLLVSLIGLWQLRKLLLLYYNDKVVAITISLLVLGSNYLNYAAIDCGMSHCWLFTVYVFLIWNTHYFYRTFRLKYAMRIGLLAGLAALTRPTDAIACLIPLLWGIERINMHTMKERLALLKGHSMSIAISLVCAICVISIQLAYWKYVSGHWLVYSYGDQGFSWLKPHFYNYTISYRSGWLVYSPMMLFAIIGIGPFLKNGTNKVAVLSFFFINYYIVSSWDIWWYGGRAMVQSYPILLFPMASLIDVVLKKRLMFWTWAAFALLFTYFNVWLTIQYHGGGLYDSDSMTNHYFWRIAGRWKAPACTVFLKDHTDVYEHLPMAPQLIYKNNFRQDTGRYYTLDHITGTTYLTLGKELQKSPAYTFPYYRSKYGWLRIQATIHCKDKEWAYYKMPQMIVRLTDSHKQQKNAVIKENMIRPERIINNNETKSVTIDVRLPKRSFDSVSISFWNAESEKQFLVTNLEAWEFKE